MFNNIKNNPNVLNTPPFYLCSRRGLRFDVALLIWLSVCAHLFVIDFTDSSNPIEIAYFDRGPYLEDELIPGGFWSVYYYEGAIYGTEIQRGLDVFKLTPNNLLTANEIDAAYEAYPVIGSRRFNPQQQIMMTWPAKPKVALAYLDQLLRDEIIEKETAKNIADKLTEATLAMETGGSRRLARQIDGFNLLSKEWDADQRSKVRLEKLDVTLKTIAEGLRK